MLITGASSGIGAELAVQYGALGARVVIAARREAELHRVAVACGPNAFPVGAATPWLVGKRAQTAALQALGAGAFPGFADVAVF